MYDKGRRFEFIGQEMRGPFSVKIAVLPRRTAEFPLRKPKLFRCAVSRFRVEYPIMRHDALEAVRVAEDPIRHVTAIAGAERRFPVLVDERIALLDIIESFHQ